MKRLLNISLCLMLGIMSLSFLALPASAQTEDDYTTTTVDEYDYDWEYDYDYDWDSTLSEEETGVLAGLLGGGALIFGGVMLVFSIIISLSLYVYTSLALMNIAKKMDQENTWFAWVPILNTVLLFKMGDQNPLLLLLLLIPGIGALIVGIFSIISLMNICEKRGYDKLLGLLALVPLANLILIGVLAWGKKE